MLDKAADLCQRFSAGLYSLAAGGKEEEKTRQAEGAEHDETTLTKGMVAKALARLRGGVRICWCSRKRRDRTTSLT